VTVGVGRGGCAAVSARTRDFGYDFDFVERLAGCVVNHSAGNRTLLGRFILREQQKWKQQYGRHKIIDVNR
jgi:hypothetical protein